MLATFQPSATRVVLLSKMKSGKGFFVLGVYFCYGLLSFLDSDFYLDFPDFQRYFHAFDLSS